MSKKQHFLIDIETTGTYCPRYAMIQIGAVHAENPSNTFFGTLKPFEGQSIDPKAMAYTGITEEEIQDYDNPSETTRRFLRWVKSSANGARPIFVSDTTAFDHSFVSYYLWEICGENPFGHAPVSLNMLYRGLTGGVQRGIYDLRETTHDHNALNDAIGNHEAWVKVEALMAERRKEWLARNP